MRAVVVHGAGDLRVEDRPDPRAGADFSQSEATRDRADGKVEALAEEAIAAE